MPLEASVLFRRLAPHAASAAAALVALLVLFPAFLSPSLRVHDEGHFLLAAETIRAGVAGVLRGTPLVVLRDEIHPLGGTLYFTAKPGHIGMLVLEGLVLGDLTTRKAIVLNILCHAMAAGLLAGIARRRFGSMPAAIAGMAYAVAPTTAFFASGALGVTTAAFFLVASAWLLDSRRPSTAWPILGGCAATMAVACHYNAAPSVLAIMLAFLPSAGRRRVVSFAAAGVVSAAVLQGATMAADHALRFAYPEFQSWWGELYHALFKHHLNAPAEAAQHFSDGVKGYGAAAWLYLLRTVFGGLSVLWFGTLLAAVCHLRLPGSRRALVPALVWALLPLAVWSLYPWKVERVFVVVAPGMAFALAAFARQAMDWPATPSARRILGVGAALALGGAGGVAVSRQQEPPPPIARLIAGNEDWIATAPRGTFNATSFHWKTAPLWKWQLGHERINTGRPSPGVDFARFDSPLVAAIDPTAGEADSNFAASAPGFAGAQPFGAEIDQGGERWFFVARDDAARRAIDGAR